eukprot:Lithocolla_globosa_v1_NODE_1767_length_2351_cov_75.861559.p1 type:complete len:386 gc:universal NODE_1767_length_2351_cov_75.861559:2134-977(-)
MLNLPYIQSAYRNIKVFPDDAILLGICWQNRFFFDLFLPFGLRSAASIFDFFAKLLCWIAKSLGVDAIFSYLDDFFMVHTSQHDCTSSQTCFENLCEFLGIPLNAKKTVLPTQEIELLGLIINSVSQQVRVPTDKLDSIHLSLEEWHRKTKATKLQLLSLIGVLGFAAKAVKHGRTFLRRMINLSTVVKAPHHLIYLNNAFRKDLNWWRLFLQRWNGISLLNSLGLHSEADSEVFVDAAKTVGFGGFWNNFWFQQKWSDTIVPDSSLLSDINWLELYALVAAAATWGTSWSSLHIHFRSDNSAVVAIVCSGTSHNEHYMDLIRLLHFLAATNNFSFSASHIPGALNVIADSLSRFQVLRFRSIATSAAEKPSHLPQLQSMLSLFE